MKKKKKVNGATKMARKSQGAVLAPFSESISFLNTVHLRFIRLVESSTKIDITDGKLPTEIKIELKAGHATRKDGDLHVIGVHVQVTVEGRAPGITDSDATCSRMSIWAHFECQYGTAVKPAADDIRALDTMGTIAVWPLARDVVLSASAKMGTPPILLPMVFVDQETRQVRFCQAGDSPE